MRPDFRLRTLLRLIAAIIMITAGIRLQAQPVRRADLTSLEGKIVNSVSAQPVHRASLLLQPAGGGTGFRSLSGADGSFVFENVPAGRYRLSAERTGFLGQEFGARSPFAAGTQLELQAQNKLTGVEFKLTPQGVITGKVFDSEDDPIPNVTVSAFRRVGIGVSRKFTKVDCGDTNDLGEFRIAGLPAGNYILAADRPPETTSSVETAGSEQNRTTYYPASAAISSAGEIAVAAGQVSAGREIRLQKSRVYSVRGTVSGAAPVRSMQITLLPDNPTEAVLGFYRATATPARDGSFRLDGVPPGSYQLTALRTDGKAQVAGVMLLEVADDVAGVDLAISEPAGLSGVVQIEGGPEISAGMRLELLAEGLAVVPSVAQIDRDGRLRVEGISRLLYRLNVSGLPPDAYVKSVIAAGRDVLENGLDLRGGAVPDLEVTVSRKAGLVAGVVHLADRLSPRSVVVITPEGARRDPLLYRKVTAGESGQFTIGSLAPGQYRLWAFPEDAQFDPYVDAELLNAEKDRAAKVTLVEGGRERVDLKVTPGDEVRR